MKNLSAALRCAVVLLFAVQQFELNAQNSMRATTRDIELRNLACRMCYKASNGESFDAFEEKICHANIEGLCDRACFVFFKTGDAIPNADYLWIRAVDNIVQQVENEGNKPLEIESQAAVNYPKNTTVATIFPAPQHCIQGVVEMRHVKADKFVCLLCQLQANHKNPTYNAQQRKVVNARIPGLCSRNCDLPLKPGDLVQVKYLQMLDKVIQVAGL